MDYLLNILRGLAGFILIPIFIYLCVKFACIGFYSAKRVNDKMRGKSHQQTKDSSN